MTYITNLNYHPDKYHFSFVRDIGASGTVTLNVDDLNLPVRSVYIEVDVPPDYGVLKLNGVNILDGHNNLVPTQITKADIEAGLLVWHAGQSDTSLRLNFDYFSFDASGEIQSMLYNWLPFNVQLAPTEAVDCGDFDTGLSDGGVPSDGGDFASGVDSTLLQSYDGGDFNTGLSSFPEAPSLATFGTVINGPLQVVDPDLLATVRVSDLPSSHELFPKDANVYRFDLVTNYTLQERLSFKIKEFRGWNYGSVVPGFGYKVDYGSITDSANTEADFNEIVNYQYPYPSSRSY